MRSRLPLMRFPFLAISLFLAGRASTAAQGAGQDLVLNGSFEKTSATGCVYNLGNDKVPGVLDDVLGIGTANELDLTQSPGCDWGVPAIDGAFKIGLHCINSAEVDAVALRLSPPVVAGQGLELAFRVVGKIENSLGPVEIGLSQVAGEFGTPLTQATPSGPYAWEKHALQFIAPHAAEFLTVRQSNVIDAYTFVDAVSLTPSVCGASAVVASETPRAGFPPNPSALLPGQTSGPVIGQVWDPIIDHATFLPSAALDFVAIGGEVTNIPSPQGTILCGLSPMLVEGGPAGAPIAITLPVECSLVGQLVVAQGGSVDLSNDVHLTNALDLVIGSL